jgi:hypothetical protein
MAAAQIPGWAGDEAESDWNTCQLGGVVIPGVVELKNVKAGIDCDTKKAKGSDQHTSKDNGTDVGKLDIHVWMNTSHWPAWLAALPNFDPRRPGRDRAPLKIFHPMAAERGIVNVRVISIEGDQPSPAKGCRRVIHCEEWFDKPKAQKPKIRPEDARDYPRVSEAIALGGGLFGITPTGPASTRLLHGPLPTIEEMDPNLFTSTNPASEESMKKTMFGSEVYQGPQ